MTATAPSQAGATLEEIAAEAYWGPQTCTRCSGALPQGLILLGRDAHIDCEEAREAWKALNAKGKAPTIRPPRR